MTALTKSMIWDYTYFEVKIFLMPRPGDIKYLFFWQFFYGVLKLDALSLPLIFRLIKVLTTLLTMWWRGKFPLMTIHGPLMKGFSVFAIIYNFKEKTKSNLGTIYHCLLKNQSDIGAL